MKVNSEGILFRWLNYSFSQKSPGNLRAFHYGLGRHTPTSCVRTPICPRVWRSRRQAVPKDAKASQLRNCCVPHYMGRSKKASLPRSSSRRNEELEGGTEPARGTSSNPARSILSRSATGRSPLSACLSLIRSPAPSGGVPRWSSIPTR